MHRVHFSSNSNEWETPQPFFDRLDAEFHFTLDAAATAENAKCAEYIDMENDALTQPWDGVVWLNPPYGRSIGKWIQKAWVEARAGATVVVLMPSRTCTPYWHDYVMRASEVRFIRGRIRFSGSSINAPFPCCVVVFRPYVEGGTTIFSSMDR